MKCTDAMLRRSPADSPEQTVAPRMTGIGCYGKPYHIARTLDRVLTRFGMTLADLATVGWQADSQSAACRRHGFGCHRHMSDGKAVVMPSHCERVKGFFLWATEDGPRLHVQMRETVKEL